MTDQPSLDPHTPLETFTRLPETDSKEAVNASQTNRLRLRGGYDKGINALIIREVGRFDDPAYGQSLRLISKKLQISKQNLNNHLRRLAAEGLIKRLPGGSATRYELTENGRRVNDFLVQSENPVKTAIGGDASHTPEKSFTGQWRYHNLLVGFRVLSWGSASRRSGARPNRRVSCACISTAVTQTSPSPCAAWASPTLKSAPSTQTGR